MKHIYLILAAMILFSLKGLSWYEVQNPTKKN